MHCDLCDVLEENDFLLFHFTEVNNVGFTKTTRRFVPDFDQNVYCKTCVIGISTFYSSLGFTYPPIAVKFSYEFDYEPQDY